MEFTEPLETFLSSPTVGFEFYGKEISCTTTKETQNGELLGINSNGSITFRFDDKEVDYHIKFIKDITLIDQGSEYSEDDDSKSVKQPGISIKNKLFNICKYRVVQHLIYILFQNNNNYLIILPLNINNRKLYLNTRTDPAKKVEIAQNILNMKPLQMTTYLEKGITQWLDNEQLAVTGSYKELKFTTNDMLSLLNSYHKLWINYIQKTNTNKPADITMHDNTTKNASQHTYINWDNWVINGTAPVDKTPARPKAEDIYLKTLWPYYFQGPFYKSLNSQSNREWKCKKCYKSPAGKVVEWYKDGTISTKCTICGNLCDASCSLKHGEDLMRCGIARINGTCKKCEHKVSDHKHIGWKSKEVAKDNTVMEAGRLKYYKTKRTVFSFEICFSCVDKAQKQQKKTNKEKIIKLKEKRKKRNKNKGKGSVRKLIINSVQNAPPVMEFKNIVIPMVTNINFKAKAKPKAKPKAAKPAPVERIKLTEDMRNYTSVRAALCFIPPKELWPKIQEIRKMHDPAYVRWMPHLNIFFPFIDERYFDTIAKYIQEEIINRNNIKAFNICLNKFDVFERVKTKLGSKSSKVETMFLNPSGCENEMQTIFSCLKGDWTTCANKHGGGFSPHLTVGKFKISSMLGDLQKFQKNWKSVTWKCDKIYLISRRGGDPFVIRHTISLC